MPVASGRRSVAGISSLLTTVHCRLITGFRLPHLPRHCITAYLENGGTLAHAQQIPAHESPRTTKLYDRTTDQVTWTRSSASRFDPDVRRSSAVSVEQLLASQTPHAR